MPGGLAEMTAASSHLRVGKKSEKKMQFNTSVKYRETCMHAV